jgi:hypothetical protein
MTQTESPVFSVLRTLRPTKSSVVLFLSLVVAAGGVAYATIPDASNGKVYLCYTAKDAKEAGGGAGLRIIDKAANKKDCDGRTELAINAQGRTGIQGRPGPAGPTGPAGPRGAAGTAGDVFSLTRNDHRVNLSGGFSEIATLYVPGPGNYLVTATVEIRIFDGDDGGVTCRLYTPGGEHIDRRFFTSDTGEALSELTFQYAQRFARSGQRPFRLICQEVATNNGQINAVNIIATRVGTVTRQE